jgi:hypothetical protein
MRKFLPVALALMLLAAPHATRTQATADAGQKNAQQARAALDAMVQALGGQAWLNMKNQMRLGQVAAFDHGKPNPAPPSTGSSTPGRTMTVSSTPNIGTGSCFTSGARAGR